jgi:hypothetical protein
MHGWKRPAVGNGGRPEEASNVPASSFCCKGCLGLLSRCTSTMPETCEGIPARQTRWRLSGLPLKTYRLVRRYYVSGPFQAGRKFPFLGAPASGSLRPEASRKVFQAWSGDSRLPFLRSRIGRPLLEDAPSCENAHSSSHYRVCPALVE